MGRRQHSHIQLGAADDGETPINSGLRSKGAAERERLARFRARRLRAAIGAISRWRLLARKFAGNAADNALGDGMGRRQHSHIQLVRQMTAKHRSILG